MKIKTIIAAAAIMAAGAVSAQYAPTKAGMALDYKSTTEKIDKPILTTDSVKSVEAVYGTTTVTIKSCIHSDDPFAAEMSMTSYYKYTTPDAPTTVVMMTGDDFKTFILNTIRTAMEQAGQFNPTQFEDATKAFSAKGQLELVLNPKGAAGEAIPNSRLRLDMGMQAATMFMSKGQIAGFEDVTVEAGTFANCIKVTYESRENSPEGSSKDYVTAWYAPEIGLVKEVKADKKGNVHETQELVAVKK